MNIDCPNPCIQCPTDVSVENFSSEAPDIDLFLARSYGGWQGANVFSSIVFGVPDLPPVGGGGENEDLEYAESEVSQDDASTVAFDNWTTNNTNKALRRRPPTGTFRSAPQSCPDKCEISNGYITPEGFIRAGNQALADNVAQYFACQRTICKNEAQQATVLCPDGQPFTFTVQAGKFSAINQATANRIAFNYARQMALINRVCLGDMNFSEACIGQNFVGQLRIGSLNRIDTVTVTAGVLPAGMELTFVPVPGGPITNVIIQGFPDSVGTYTFTITAENQFGLMSREYTITVNDILNSANLPDATSGTPYLEAMAVAGPTEGGVQWAVTTGALPAGMTLNLNTGIISGTPTDTETTIYEFVISVRDGQ